MRVLVDHGKCRGAALCVRERPQVFRFDNEMEKAVVKVGWMPDVLDDKMRHVAALCPNQAIVVVDEDM